MKKIAILLFCAISLPTIAQFTVTRLDGSPGGTPIVDGQLITVTNISRQDAEIKFKVTNPSTTDPINVKIQVEDITNGTGADFQLCFGDLCFFSVTEGNSYPPNFPVTLDPEQSTGNFDHFWNTNLGDGINPVTYVLRFYQINDNGVEIGNDLTVTYRYDSTLGTNEFNNATDMGIEYPNTLIENEFVFSSIRNVQANVYGINGNRINSSSFQSGLNLIDMSTYATGLYFIVFEDIKGYKSTVKVQKK
jgi:hypothetical protein